MKTSLILCLGMIVLSPLLYAQTGPAGVGTSATNSLWLLASTGTNQSSGGSAATADLDIVGEWLDQSGNTHHFVQNTAANRPVLRTGANGINGRPAIEFDATNDFLEDSDGDLYINGLSGISLFFVAQSYTTGTDAGFFDAENPDGGDDVLAFRYDDAGANSGRDNIVKFGISTTGGSQQLETSEVIGGENVQSLNPQLIGMEWESASNLTYYLNGTVDSSPDLNSGARTGTLNGATLAMIGRGPKDNANAWDGKVAEVIFFNYRVNTTQRRLVNNYLSSRYSITIPTDYYGFEASHAEDIAGIGRTTSSDTHLEGFSDRLGLQILASDFADGTYALLGHDNGATTFSGAEAPNGDTNAQKIGREWRVDLTGAATEVMTVKADLTGFSLPIGYNDYGIFVDSDGNFSSDATFYPLSLVSGSEYEATGVTINDGNYITIAAINREVQFVSATASDFETVANPSLSIEINYENDANVDVTISDAGTGTASGSDYSFTDGTFTITAGNITAPVLLTLTNDTDLEASETVILSMSAPSEASLGTNTTLTFTINDDDNPRKIFFDDASSNGSEGSTSVSIPISLNSVDAFNPTSADYAVTAGTATGGGVDYTLASGTFVISAGNSTGNLNVTISDDALSEADETIVITLSNPVNANLSATFLEHTYTINDNDTPPSVEFTVSSSSQSENSASASIEFTLSEISGADIAVSFSINGSSTALGSGTDYTLTSPSPVIITAGNLTTNLTVSITNDAVEELDETIIFDLDSATNATLGAITSHTFSILDNDGLGSTGSGGVGDSNSIIVWLDASLGTFQTSGGSAADTDGQTVEEWQDKSGNGFHMTQSTASDRPTFRTGANGINNRPVLEFDGTNDKLQNLVVDSQINGLSEFTVFMVVRNSDATSHDRGIFHTVIPDGNDDELGARYDAAGVEGGGTNLMKFGIQTSSGNYQYESGSGIQSTSAQIIMMRWSSGNDMELFIDGSSDTPAYTSTPIGGTITGSDRMIVGQGTKDAGSGWQGDIAELIMFNSSLNNARRIIIENYLAEKYNIAVPNDNLANATYTSELIGVGREADGSHFVAEGGGLILRSNGVLDSNGDYVIAAHNGDPVSDGTDFLASSTAEGRWTREWVLEVTGTLSGSLIVGFDFSEAGLSFSPDNATNYVLLQRSNTSSNFSDVSYSSVNISGDQVLFTVPIGSLKMTGDATILASGDLITLGSSDLNASPLPVEFEELHIEPNFSEGFPVLKWSTLTEEENFGFRILRSDGIDLSETEEEIAFVEGAGFSTDRITYSYTDNTLEEAKTYTYSLIQVDYDGKQTVLTTQEFQFAKPERFELYQNYPNPFNPTTTLPYDVAEQSFVRIALYDILGRQVKTLVDKAHAPGKYHLQILGSELSSGMYIVSMQAQGRHLSRKILLLK